MYFITSEYYTFGKDYCFPILVFILYVQYNKWVIQLKL